MFDSIVQQKSAIRSILHLLKSEFNCEPYLAGGMLRDHYFQRPGNDLDIYIEQKSDFDYETFMVPFLNGLPNFENFDVMCKNTYDEGYAGNAILAVYEGSYDYNEVRYPVQIIIVKEHPRIYIEEIFCCSLSKVWQTAYSEPVYHQSFVDSITQKLIEFDFSNFQSINYNYIEKILKRFPEFEVDNHTKQNYLNRVQLESYWR